MMGGWWGEEQESERGYLGAGRESVNSLDLRCPDLASGGREDGLATKDPLRRHRRVELGGDGGSGRKKRARRISMA